jgi:hypothetical protein
MDFRFPETEGTVLTSWETVSISIRAVVLGVNQRVSDSEPDVA